jgi:pyruvate ferredoxin oxidoreductase alpha subunit
MSFEVMVGNKATATAVKLARVQVASAFPVTPQTTITEYLSEMVANGELDAGSYTCIIRCTKLLTTVYPL